MLTTRQAAERIGKPIVTVRYWCKKQWVKSEKIGRDWMIDEESLLKFIPPKPGRPPNGAAMERFGARRTREKEQTK